MYTGTNHTVNNHKTASTQKLNSPAANTHRTKTTQACETITSARVHRIGLASQLTKAGGTHQPTTDATHIRSAGLVASRRNGPPEGLTAVPDVLRQERGLDKPDEAPTVNAQNLLLD